MQFLILLIGTLVFVFYQYHTPPLFFNQTEVTRIEQSIYKTEYKALEEAHRMVHVQKQQHADELLQALDQKENHAVDLVQLKLLQDEQEATAIRNEALALMSKNNEKSDLNDTNYVFLSFVMQYLPHGLVGLLIAIILLASMGSTASGMNSLASTTVVDFYKRFVNKAADAHTYLSASRWATVAWGLFCVGIALYASKLGNLIEAVNILGSLFYGTILGIFLVAFYLKNVKGTAVFYAALVTEVFVVCAWLMDWMAFLWLNAIGCLLLMFLAWLIQQCFREAQQA